MLLFQNPGMTKVRDVGGALKRRGVFVQINMVCDSVICNA